MLIVGLGALFVIVINDAGGFDALVSSITAGAESVNAPRNGRPLSFLTTAEAWAIPVCGSIIAQELVSRVIATRTPTIARRSSLIAGVLYVIIGLIPAAVGLLGIRAIPNLEHAEQILPLMARQHLSIFFYMLFAGALVSAILSTVDSSLLAASGLLVHNMVLPMRASMNEARKITVQRAGTLLMGVIAYVLAMYAEGVYDLVTDASSFGSAGIFIVFVFGMFTKYGGTRTAVASLIAGAAVWIVSHYVFYFEPSYLLALGSALVFYMFGAMVEQSPVSAAINMLSSEEGTSQAR